MVVLVITITVIVVILPSLMLMFNESTTELTIGTLANTEDATIVGQQETVIDTGGDLTNFNTSVTDGVLGGVVVVVIVAVESRQCCRQCIYGACCG